MLILSRKLDEQIMIGDDIAIMIVDISGDQVQVGISMPPKPFPCIVEKSTTRSKLLRRKTKKRKN